MDVAKEMDLIEDARKSVQNLTREVFEDHCARGEELSPVAILVMEGNPDEKSPYHAGFIRSVLRAVFYEKGKSTMVLMDVSSLFNNEGGKNLCSLMLRDLIKRFDAYYVAIVSESWVSKCEKGKWDGKPASKQDNRTEAVTILESSRYADRYVMATIEMKDGCRVMGEWSSIVDGATTTSGRFANFFEDRKPMAEA